jgi:hypothetical protein
MRADTSTTQARVGGRRRIRIGPRSVATLALTALACAGLVAAAFAGGVKYDTTLGGHQEGGFYHGPVQSEVHKCEVGRQVVLFELRPGADRKVGADRSGGDGWWTVVPGHRGRFYAKVRRESANGYVCLADRKPNHGAF